MGEELVTREAKWLGKDYRATLCRSCLFYHNVQGFLLMSRSSMCWTYASRAAWYSATEHGPWHQASWMQISGCPLLTEWPWAIPSPASVPSSGKWDPSIYFIHSVHPREFAAQRGKGSVDTSSQPAHEFIELSLHFWPCEPSSTLWTGAHTQVTEGYC